MPNYLILAKMIISQLLLHFGLLSYLIYGIVKTVKNKNLHPLHKVIWIAVIIMLPVLGTSAYLRANFSPRS
ncbi:PLDc N-terminal domain-containing protein [Pedobacter sp. MC2016-14]|uniref:PLDc N-terminal domain-containing protein n=1 Tax=Pedobacter sp. MC2016-14 TaxID=2897327 RepID=UPI00351D34F2